MKSAARYAVYWVPERAHPLWRAGCEWLGSDPEDGTRVDGGRPFVVDPRRYGFHATLKAPMHLSHGAEEDAFVEAVRAFAATVERFPMPTLEVRALAGFVALRPTTATTARDPLRVLADRCVAELDGFRAAFDAREWALRSAGLDADERGLLRSHGYQHVLDRWRFHVTLSDSFAADAAGLAARARMQSSAEAFFGDALRAPLVASEVAVFVEAQPGRSFRLAHRLPLSG